MLTHDSGSYSVSLRQSGLARHTVGDVGGVSCAAWWTDQFALQDRNEDIK